MRSHEAIIRDAGGALAVHARLDLEHQQEMVKSWLVRDRIPQEYWRAFADQGFCTLDELATWAALRAGRNAVA
jgi:hypothetical protein